MGALNGTWGGFFGGGGSAAGLDPSLYLLRSGGTMLGPLFLYGDPTLPREAVTLEYLETQLDNTLQDAKDAVQIGLVMPAEFTVTGSAAGYDGTFTVELADQAANMVFAGPVSGADAPPSFRALVAADISDLDDITDLYLPLTGGSLTGSLDITGDLSATGKLEIGGDVSVIGKAVLPTIDSGSSTPVHFIPDLEADQIVLSPDIQTWGTVQGALAAIDNSILTLSRGMSYVGSYDAENNIATFVPALSALNGPLPPANSAGLEQGDFLIATSDSATIKTGDQLIASGGPNWDILAIGHPTMTASMVALSPQVGSWTTAQEAIQALPAALDAKATRAGDLGGTTASTTVIGLQTRAVANTSPVAGQALAWSGSAWTPTGVVDLVSDQAIAGEKTFTRKLALTGAAELDIEYLEYGKYLGNRRMSDNTTVLNKYFNIEVDFSGITGTSNYHQFTISINGGWSNNPAWGRLEASYHFYTTQSGGNLTNVYAVRMNIIRSSGFIRERIRFGTPTLANNVFSIPVEQFSGNNSFDVYVKSDGMRNAAALQEVLNRFRLSTAANPPLADGILTSPTAFPVNDIMTLGLERAYGGYRTTDGYLPDGTLQGAIVNAQLPFVFRRPSVTISAVLPDTTLLDHILNYGDFSFEQYIVAFVGRFADVGSSNISPRLHGSHYFLSVIKATFDSSRTVTLTSYTSPARRFVNTITSSSVWAGNWTEHVNSRDVGIAETSPTGTNATRYIKIASYPAPTTTSSQAAQLDLQINARMNSAVNASVYLLSLGLVRAALPYTVTGSSRRLDLNVFVSVEFGYVRNDTAGTFDIYAKTTQNYPNLTVSRFTLNSMAANVTLFPAGAAWEAPIPADGDNAYTVIPQQSIMLSPGSDSGVARLAYIGSTAVLPQTTLRDYILAQGNFSFEVTIMNFPTRFSDLANLTTLQPAMNTYCHLSVQRVTADNAFLATVTEGGSVANPRMFYRTAGGTAWQSTGWTQIATDRQINSWTCGASPTATSDWQSFWRHLGRVAYDSDVVLSVSSKFADSIQVNSLRVFVTNVKSITGTGTPHFRDIRAEGWINGTTSPYYTVNADNSIDVWLFRSTGSGIYVPTVTAILTAGSVTPYDSTIPPPSSPISPNATYAANPASTLTAEKIPMGVFVPAPPATGTVRLQSVSGVLGWAV